jgi:hypothetical protein
MTTSLIFDLRWETMDVHYRGCEGRPFGGHYGRGLGLGNTIGYAVGGFRAVLRVDRRFCQCAERMADISPV